MFLLVPKNMIVTSKILNANGVEFVPFLKCTRVFTLNSYNADYMQHSFMTKLEKFCKHTFKLEKKHFYMLYVSYFAIITKMQNTILGDHYWKPHADE